MSLVANFNVYLIHTTLYLSLHNATDPIRGVNLHHRVLEHIVTLIRQVVKQLMRVLGTRSLHHNFQHHLVHSATQPCTFMCDVLQMGGEKVLGNAVQINKYKIRLYIESTTHLDTNSQIPEQFRHLCDSTRSIRNGAIEAYEAPVCRQASINTRGAL